MGRRIDHIPEDETENLSRQRFTGHIDGSIVARTGFAEKLYMGALLGMAGLIAGLLAFICVQVYYGNRENGALEAAFREYATATNRRLDTLERMFERILLDRQQ